MLDAWIWAVIHGRKFNLECKECSTLLATKGIDDKARCKEASRDADRDLYLPSDSQNLDL